MSTYVREKVLRIPMQYVDLTYIKNGTKQKFKDEDYEDDFTWYLETAFPDIFDYATVGKFQISPTDTSFFDYVLDYEYDTDGEYGKTRSLNKNKKKKYLPVFQQIVEFCWYNVTEAPDYYDDTNDSFYDEVH